jgi:hypothetical protein
MLKIISTVRPLSSAAHPQHCNALCYQDPAQHALRPPSPSPPTPRSAAILMLLLRCLQSGVDLDNAHEFLNNGAASVGLVGPLFDANDVSSGNWVCECL